MNARIRARSSHSVGDIHPSYGSTPTRTADPENGVVARVRSVSESPMDYGPADSAYNAEDGERTGLLSGLSTRVVQPESSTVRGSAWYEAVFLVVNAALGAGLLNFPAAYHKCGGLVVAIGVQLALMVFVVGSLLILVYCSDINQSGTYQDVVFSFCGKHAQLVCAAIITLYCFGTCITFFIIIADQWDKFFHFLEGDYFCYKWYMNRKFTLPVTAVLFVLPLCFPRRIDFLKYASIIGFLAVVYCVILVTVKYFVGTNHPGPVRISPSHWTDVFIVVPVICFGYQCHLSVVPIYSCMDKRTVPEFIKTVLIALGLCLFAYTGTASFGYLTFGSKVKEDILLSYKPTADVLVAVALIAVKMYTTYPILSFIGRSALDSVWVHVRSLEPEDVATGEKRRRIIITLIWFTASLLLAIIVPNIGIVISLLGGLAAVFVFVFPGLCLLQLVLSDQSPFLHSRLKHYSMMLLASTLLVIGGFMFGVIMSQSIMKDITGSKPIQTDPCF